MIMKNTKMNKRQYAYYVIRSRILDGTYVAGQRVVIDQIAKEVNSSHIPVREAIHQLESEQLIEYEPNVGAIVKVINKQDFEQTLEVLAVLEGYATALSAAYVTEKTIDQLTAINLKMKHQLERYETEEAQKTNRLFHYTIYQHCPNEPLIRNIRELWERLDIVRQNGLTFFPPRTSHTIQEHEQLLQLFRDEASFVVIERAAREHKMNTLHTFRETYQS